MIRLRSDACVGAARDSDGATAVQHAETIVVPERAGPPISTADAQGAAICTANHSAGATKPTRGIGQCGSERVES